MGENQSWLFEPSFNRSVKVESKDEQITSDAGVLLLREVDHRLGIVETLANNLYDPRRQDRIRYSLTELLRERLYAMAQGYSTQDDTDRLAHDPAFKMAVWDRRGGEVVGERLASQPTQSRLIEILNFEDNRQCLYGELGESLKRYLLSTGAGRRVRNATIDLDSFPVEVYGEQTGGNYNGHYQAKIYHPLIASMCVEGKFDPSRPGGRLGNGFVGALLRSGNAYTTDDGLPFLKMIIDQVRQMSVHFDVRLDAGFVTGEYLDYLADKKIRFAGRIKANPRLHELAERHLNRPTGRPPKEGYHRIVELGRYQADKWQHSQRLILVIVDEPDSNTGLLFEMPRYFFLVTNFPCSTHSGRRVLQHYRQRGTFEDRLAEFNKVLGPHLSLPTQQKNQISLLLALLAFNLSSFLRLELEDAKCGSWDLTRFRECVLKAGGRVVRHGRRLVVKVARAVAVFWSHLAKRMARWKLPTSLSQPIGPKHRVWMPPPDHAHFELVYRE